MKNHMSAIVCSAFLMSCAETRLIENEDAVLSEYSVSSKSTLSVLGDYSSRLTNAYTTAAREASNGQDVAAIVTYVSAASFVVGAIGSASDGALANRALVGAGSTSFANRTLSKETISGIYSAAKRMNCVSTNARMGAFLLDGTSSTTKGMARAATFGAIEEIRIITREALVRDVADFSTIRNDLIDNITLSEDQNSALARMQKVASANELVLLNQYLKLLDNCLVDITMVTAVEPIDTSNTGN